MQFVEGRRAKAREYQARYRAKHPERVKERQRQARRKIKFGIAPEQYDQMLDDQCGVCAICGQPETATQAGRVRALAVDHDHTTGAVRGLLCSGCNTGLGGFRDDPTRLKTAINYLEEHAVR